ncbi:MAG: hypothetical protein EOM26_10665 [Alphaproteobacteria bacterium]|nr:hypothetical protein [Alphaproteobacteria bacterium]
MQGETRVNIYKATKILQAKVGSGAVEKEKVEVCQKQIDENQTDFGPMAKEFLDELTRAVTFARAGKEDLQSLRQHVTQPVMQLKANGAMFGYTLIGDLANIMLNFLETVSRIDDDIIAIVEAHQKTLAAIVNNQMKGDGGATGKMMKDELVGACKRYMEKRHAKGNS